MKRTFLFLAMLLLASAAYADIPRPDATPRGNKAKPIDTYLSIELDKDAKEARLLIPRSQVSEFRAQLDAMDNGADDTAASSAGSFTRLQTIVSGVFLSLAMVFGGIWFARSGKLSARASKSAAAAMVIFAGGAFAAMVYGNAGPPAEARSITGRMFGSAMHLYKFGGGKIKLEISDTERNPRLIVPDTAKKTSE